MCTLAFRRNVTLLYTTLHIFANISIYTTKMEAVSLLKTSEILRYHYSEDYDINLLLLPWREGASETRIWVHGFIIQKIYLHFEGHENHRSNLYWFVFIICRLRAAIPSRRSRHVLYCIAGLGVFFPPCRIRLRPLPLMSSWLSTRSPASGWAEGVNYLYTLPAFFVGHGLHSLRYIFSLLRFWVTR